MNDLSIVSHIKNDIEFLDQFWKHIHTYNPREIIILDTGSVDGTYEKLLGYEQNPETIYTIEKYRHYSGQIHVFNKVIGMATSTWIMKIDTDELYKRSTQEQIIKAIHGNQYNCVNLPTIHHFISSDLYFNCIDKHPDYHQRIFKKEVFEKNAEVGSKNHGSIMWAKPINMLTLGIDHAMYHYSFLRSFEKLQKRAIINYYIDTVKTDNIDLLKSIENHPVGYIHKFEQENPNVIPVWQTEPTLIPFNSLEDYYIEQFIKWGKKVEFDKPEDLEVDKIAEWPKAEKILKEVIWK